MRVWERYLDETVGSNIWSLVGLAECWLPILQQEIKEKKR